jgi:putative transposase
MRQNAMRARPKRRGKPKDDGDALGHRRQHPRPDFQADRPNQKWLADFTYIWTAEGWLYVAVVLDLFSRRVVGWSMKADRDASLVMDALMMAVWRGARPTRCCTTRTRGRNTAASSSSVCCATTASPAR